jgi:hypothetical protein
MLEEKSVTYGIVLRKQTLFFFETNKATRIFTQEHRVTNLIVA